VKYVLFVCTHNAGRSQMAAGWLNHLAGDRVDVFSGGSEPASTVNPPAAEAMAEVGIDIGQLLRHHHARRNGFKKKERPQPILT